MCVRTCVCICLSGDIIYEHERDLRLELGSFILLSGKDGDNTAILGCQNVPLSLPQAEPTILIIPHKQQQQQQKSTP